MKSVYIYIYIYVWYIYMFDIYTRNYTSFSLDPSLKWSEMTAHPRRDDANSSEEYIYIYIYIYSYTYIYTFHIWLPNSGIAFLITLIYIYIYIWAFYAFIVRGQWRADRKALGGERGVGSRTSRWNMNPGHHERSCTICQHTNHKAMDADWINFICNEVPDRISKNLVLCSLHFTTHSFTNKAHSKPDFHKDSN